MVMDAQPTPQSVGREFVRQYYTLLNKAPNHLHRFYNIHSSFIHGGLDSHNREATLVIGQKNIHNKIQQLNFRDCHAKISQVDAQATLGNGVVVQVTGELSNDGQPMRRFTQTFVLAAQSPKNYYVHNDIFRYQDLYSDDENDGESRSENDEEQESEAKIIDSGNQANPMAQPQQIYYSIPSAAVAHAAVAAHAGVGQTVPIAFPAQPPQVNGVVHDDLLQGIQQSAQIVPAATAAVVAATPNQQGQQPQQQQQQQPPVQPGQQAQQVQQQPPQQPTVPHQQPLTAIPSMAAPLATGSISQPSNVSSPLESGVNKENIASMQTLPELTSSSDGSLAKTDLDLNKNSAENPDKHDAMKMSNKPKTYATLLKSMNTTGTSGFVPLPTPSHQTITSAVQTSIKTQELRSDNTPATALPQRTNSTRQTKEFPERRTSNTNAQFGDSNQLFFGNVPHHATEEELKALFGKFGSVVDLRIHSKAVPKMTGARLPPYYGFITYEDPESVQNCLANCPLYFPDNSPDGQKLNVEEKKTRVRGPNDIPRMSNNNLSGGTGGMGNTQRTTGGGQFRSISNSGGLMRGGSGGGGGPVRGGATGGPRPTGATRNDRGPGGPPPVRGNGNGTPNTGGTYNRR